MAASQVKILLVEADPLMAQAIAKFLMTQHQPQTDHDYRDAHDYKVDVAHNSQVGLAWAETICYDLIILDVTLPKLDDKPIDRSVLIPRIVKQLVKYA